MNIGSYSNLRQRVVSALVLAALVLFLTWIGGFPFRVLAALIAGAVFYEWCSMAPGGLKTGWPVPASAFGLAVIALLWNPGAPIVLIVMSITCVFAAIMAETKGQGLWIAKGFAYAALSGFSLAYLRGASMQGLVAILFLFATVWATDVAAYFTGRSLGGPRLARSISPDKTWSGAIGGAIGGVACGSIVAAIAGSAGYGLFVVAVLLSIVSQVGDLFESGVKRTAGVKDSGNLIPGHGGVMDRVDGLVAAAMALYVICAVGGNLSHPALSLF